MASTHNINTNEMSQESRNTGFKEKAGKTWVACQSCCYKSGGIWNRMTFWLPLTLNTFHFNPLVVKIISLIVGCFGMAMSSSVYSSFAWQTPMRAILNQTETDSNLVSTLGNLGMTLAFPAGMCYEIFGNQMAALIGVILYAISYMLLWFGTTMSGRIYYAANKWAVDFLYFLVGFAGSFTYMASLMPNVDNFTFKQRGTVIGLLDASLSLGPTLLSIMYNSAFTDGHIKEGEEALQNLSGFFMTVGFIAVGVNCCLFFFVGRVAPPKTEEASVNNNDRHQDVVVSETSPDEKYGAQKSVLEGSETGENIQHPRDDSFASSSMGQIEEKPPSIYSEYPFTEMSINHLVFRWDFYFLLVQFVLSACLQLTYQSNIATYLRSFHMNEYNMLFTVLNTVLQTVTKFIAGIASDLIAHAGLAPRAVVCLVPYGIQTFFLFLSAFYGDNFIVMIMTCIFVGVANGCAWCMSPMLIGELFGGKHMGSNWGWTMVLTAALGFPFTIGFSSVYEAAITPPGSDIYCYGLGCFTWSFIMLAGASLSTFIMVLGLTQNMVRNASYRRANNAQATRPGL